MQTKLIALLIPVYMIFSLSACGITVANSNSTEKPLKSQMDGVSTQKNYSDTFVSEVKTAIKDKINSDEESITDVILKDSELYVTVDLSKSNSAPLTLEDLAISRAASITDAILELTDYDNQWTTITIDFINVGKITNNKDEMEENEFGSRYFPFETLTLK